MKEKKEAAEWYVGAVHFFIAGLLVPVVIGVFIAIVSAMTSLTPLIESYEYTTAFYVLAAIVNALLIWIGVIYSQTVIFSRYRVTNATNVVRAATAWMIAFSVALSLFSYVFPDPEYPMTPTDWAVSFANDAIAVIVFYVLSWRYFTRHQDGETVTN